MRFSCIKNQFPTSVKFIPRFFIGKQTAIKASIREKTMSYATKNRTSIHRPQLVISKHWLTGRKIDQNNIKLIMNENGRVQSEGTQERGKREWPESEGRGIHVWWEGGVFAIWANHSIFSRNLLLLITWNLILVINIHQFCNLG